MFRLLWCLFLISTNFLLVGCGPEQVHPVPKASASRLQVVVSIEPQAYFIERLAGDRAVVTVLVSPGQSPHTFEPLPAQVAALERAAAYFIIGMAFEGPLAAKVRAARPELQVTDMRHGIQMLPMAESEAQHTAITETMDPHVWLDPNRAIIMARNVQAALARLDPAGQPIYETNLQALITDLQGLDRRLRKLLSPLRGQEILVFHPAFGYFCDAYGLKQVAIEHAGKEPEAKQLAALIERAREHEVKVIFMQPSVSDLTARAIAREIGATVVPLDDLARDYLSNLERMASALAQGAAKSDKKAQP